MKRFIQLQVGVTLLLGLIERNAMIDMDYLIDLPEHPTMEDLMFAFECYRKSAGGAAHVIDVIKRFRLAKDTGYRKLRELEQLLFGKSGTLFRRKPGKSPTKAVGPSELFNHIADTVRAYENLRKTISGRLRIELGATNICQLRLVPEIYRRFRSPHYRQGAEMAVNVQFHLQQGEYWDLLKSLRQGDLDLAITTCPKNIASKEFVGVKLIGEVMLPRCLVYPMDHPFNEQPEWKEQFGTKGTQGKAWSRLRGETLVVLDNPEAEPDFPWQRLNLVNDQNRRVKVDTYAQAHAHCLAGVGLAFTHQELLSEDEEQHLTVVDVSEKLGKSRLCALLSKSVRTRRSKAENQVIDSLVLVISEYLKDMAARVGHRNGEFTKLADYKYLWHTTTVKDDIPMWVPGTVRLQTTPAGLVKGSEESEIRKKPFRILGHILDEHLIWHGISADAESSMRGRRSKGEFIDHYAIDFYLKKSRTLGYPLVGTWVGRDYSKRERSGVAVLHTDKIDSWQELAGLVRAAGIKQVETDRACKIAGPRDIL